MYLHFRTSCSDVLPSALGIGYAPSMSSWDRLMMLLSTFSELWLLSSSRFDDDVCLHVWFFRASGACSNDAMGLIFNFVEYELMGWHPGL